MADDNVPPRRPRGDEDGPRDLTCGFCKCTVSRRGEVLRRSAEAKQYLDSEDVIERLNRQVATKDARIAELEATIADLKNRPEPAPAGAGEGAADRW